jgi:phospholipid/cholesterol/gamma-HCH transport system permease protein
MVAEVRLVRRPIAILGRGARTVERRTEGLGRFAVFSLKVLWHALIDVVARLRYRATVLHNISDIVTGAGAFVIGGGMVFVVATMALAVGATVGVQAVAGLSQLGAESYIGIVGALANTREITPLIAGVALSAQVGGSFTAEIGAMRISEEIDALEVMSIPSLVYLVSTRIVALICALVPLYLVALFASFFGTRVVTTELLGASPGLYDYYFGLYLPPIDIFYSVTKVAIFAIQVGLIHGYFGYYATGGPAGVGRAVGVAIRITIITLVVTNLLLSYVFWGTTTTVTLTA